MAQLNKHKTKTIDNLNNSWHIAKHMKKTILGVLVAVMLIPAFSQASTPVTQTVAGQETSLEEQKRELLLQIISLLQLRIQQLIAIRDGLPVPTVLGISTTTAETVEEEPRKRRGGGGGSSSSNRAATEAKETACRLAGDLAIAPGDTKLAYYAINGEPVYAGWAPNTTRELYDYLTAYMENFIETDKIYYTHIPDYKPEFAARHLLTLETRLSEHYINKEICGEETLNPEDSVVAPAEVVILQERGPTEEQIISVNDTEATFGENIFNFNLSNYTSGDIFITDIQLKASTTPETPLTDVFARVNLSGQDLIATTSDGYINFNHLSILLPENEIKPFALIAELLPSQGNYESGTEVNLEMTGLAVSTKNTDSNIPVSVSGKVFQKITLVNDISAPTSTEPYQATLEFNSSSDNPDATILVVDKDDKTDFTILVFELEAQEGPVTIGDAYIRVETPDGIASTTIDDSELIINGVVHDQDGIQAIEGNNSAQVHMFRLDTVVATNTPLEIEFSVEFEGYDGVYDVPQEVFASIDLDTRSLWEAEGYDDLNPATDYLGTVTGETHTLFGAGLYLEDVDTTTELIQFDTGGSVGVFEIEFEATAIEENFYFTDTATTSNLGKGLQFYIDGPDAITVISAVMTSTADEQSNGVYEIQEGETQEITLQIEIETSESGNFRIGLQDLFVTENFDGMTDTQSTVILDPYEFRTDYLVIIAE